MFSKTNPVENFFVENARYFIKAPDLVANSTWTEYFNRTYKPSKNITTISTSNKMIAHKLPSPNGEKKNKMAIVYIPGNCDYVANSLQRMEPLLQFLSKSNIDNDTSYDCFCQDYRGRGFNQETSKENFNHYPLSQDALDQAALIKKLVDDGYLIENILVLGYSLGSLIALWSIFNLINKYGSEYSKLKFYSDRGLGNLWNFPGLRNVIWDQKIANERLYQKGMHPLHSLHDIANTLPNTFIFRVAKDNCIHDSISLAETFKPEELPGRVWTGAIVPDKIMQNSHFVNHDSLQTKQIPELIPYHFMTAMLHEKTIHLDFSFILVDTQGQKISGYHLSDTNSADFISLSLPDSQANIDKNQINIHSDAIFKLVRALHEYCIKLAKEAASSGTGGRYTQQWFGWTAKANIEGAINIMQLLCAGAQPDIKSIQRLLSTPGPHLCDELHKLFLDVVQFADEYTQLQYFNQWITEMPALNKKDQQKLKSPGRLSFVKDPWCEWTEIPKSNDEPSTTIKINF